jgi:hypothetical protein
MQTHIRGYCERAATPAEPGTPIRFIASTEAVARDGLVIEAGGWDLDNFRANPTFLWHHDYSGARPPIGRVADVSVVKGQLIADVVFDQGDPFAVDVERKYREGFISAVSVGWETHEMDQPRGKDETPRITKAELLDISAVNIPGDPNALMERQKRAMAESARAILTLVDDTEPNTESANWERVSRDMLSLYASTAQRPEPERYREYRRIARDYARHSKTPPEYLTADEISAWGVDELRGLFLESEDAGYDWLRLPEPERRAGAVLSKRNADDLQQAIGLIAGVMERATKEPETPELDTDEAERSVFTAIDRLYNSVKDKQ